MPSYDDLGMQGGRRLVHKLGEHKRRHGDNRWMLFELARLSSATTPRRSLTRLARSPHHYARSRRLHRRSAALMPQADSVRRHARGPGKRLSIACPPIGSPARRTDCILRICAIGPPCRRRIRESAMSCWIATTSNPWHAIANYWACGSAKLRH